MNTHDEQLFKEFVMCIQLYIYGFIDRW